MSAEICPRCEHEQQTEPLGFTFQGAAEFYCEACERFWQDFDWATDAEAAAMMAGEA